MGKFGLLHFLEVVASMPQRINAVLEAKGGPTHY